MRATELLAVHNVKVDVAAQKVVGKLLIDPKAMPQDVRLSPDGKQLIFGGRARFTAAPPEVSAPILYQYMIDRFPQLKGIRITHVWTGNVAFALDSMSHMGQDDGMHYLLACNGSGVATCSPTSR